MSRQKVLKRNGITIEDFDSDKIFNAIMKAMKAGNKIDVDVAKSISNSIHEEISGRNSSTPVTIHEIEDMVYDALVTYGFSYVAKRYEGYRAVQEYKRTKNPLDDSILGLIDGTNVFELRENSNKKGNNAGTQRDLIAGQYSRDWTKRCALPADILEAHNEGIIHFHDSDYFVQRIINCCLINLKDCFKNGTVINDHMIETPKSFHTACTVATQISQQVANGQYGGQSWSISHLAPYLRVSRDKIRRFKRQEWNKYGYNYTEQELEDAVMVDLKRELSSGIQTIQFQISTFATTNGQTPFLTVFIYLNEEPEYIEETAMIAEEIFKQRILGLKNVKGVYVAPSFPKLIYVLDENNTYEGSEYFWLTKLAAECTAKRMVPDYISAKIMKQNYEGQVFTPMGCRAFLSPWKDPETGKYKWYGRFNQGTVCLNLADVALSADGDIEKFWPLLDERLELCYRALMIRHERLKGTSVEVSPIHFKYGVISRLNDGDTIDSLLYDGYSTLSLGYAALYECVLALLGVSHTDSAGEELALTIMKHIKKRILEWKEKTNIGFALYGTPLENTTYKFARTLKKRFGVIEHITDRDYVTNSYHVFVGEKIDAFKKLSFEAQFQDISSGGAVSYVEVPDMTNNIEAIISVMQHIYETIQYAELNGKHDYCHVCGYEGEILINDKGEWYCPYCGNKEQEKMNVVRRTCGYLGENFWNEGRTMEIKDRVMHL